jgi:hypothetical protein
VPHLRFTRRSVFGRSMKVTVPMMPVIGTTIGTAVLIRVEQGECNALTSLIAAQGAPKVADESVW